MKVVVQGCARVVFIATIGPQQLDPAVFGHDAQVAVRAVGKQGVFGHHLVVSLARNSVREMNERVVVNDFWRILTCDAFGVSDDVNRCLVAQ